MSKLIEYAMENMTPAEFAKEVVEVAQAELWLESIKDNI